MPSQARKKFDENAADIEQLVDMYEAMEKLWEDEPGDFPEGMDVLFRSAVVLMVSHWEAYIEDICGEALEHLVKHSKDSSALPKAIKQQVASEILASKNKLEAWNLADDGWQKLLRARLAAMKVGRDRGFNSPKAQQTKEFVSNTVGIDDVTKSWTLKKTDPKSSAKKLDALVAVRGEIAHRGRIKEKLNMDYIAEHIAFLRGLVAKTGGDINAHVERITKKGLW